MVYAETSKRKPVSTSQSQELTSERSANVKSVSVSDGKSRVYGSNFSITKSREIKWDVLLIRVKIVRYDDSALAEKRDILWGRYP